jgi:hypothetical protein
MIFDYSYQFVDIEIFSFPNNIIVEQHTPPTYPAGEQFYVKAGSNNGIYTEATTI